MDRPKLENLTVRLLPDKSVMMLKSNKLAAGGFVLVAGMAGLDRTPPPSPLDGREMRRLGKERGALLWRGGGGGIDRLM